jgi:cell division septation protein DedD
MIPSARAALVVNGNGAAGRLLVDSVIAHPTRFGDLRRRHLLACRAAATSADAEHDYNASSSNTRSAHAGDALFNSPNPRCARRSLPRPRISTASARESRDDDRGRAGLMLVRVAFDQNEPQHACGRFGARCRTCRRQRSSHNQLDYSPRCGMSTARARLQRRASRDSTRRDSAAAASARRDSTPAPRASKARYTLQVAAYGSKADADALAKRLKARGVDVRVAGSARMFRVRIGHYETRAAAAAAARELKAKKIDAFVTEIGGDDK